MSGEDRAAYAMDPGFFTVGREVAPTMLANMGNYPHVIFQPGKPARRIMPVEAARLQGFPDHWGEIDRKDALSDEEYAFWTDVRATHAKVNGKAARKLDRRALLEWYNALHTESNELKMWGNGIALPPALYCMQGMAAELREERGMA